MQGNREGCTGAVCDKPSLRLVRRKGRKDKLHSLQLQLELLYRAASVLSPMKEDKSLGFCEEHCAEGVVTVQLSPHVGSSLAWLESLQSSAPFAAPKTPHLSAPMCVGAGGVDVSMLQQAVRLVSGRLETEASGNITADTIRTVADTGVTYISCGSLTHSVKALDISLKIQVQQA